MNITNLEMTQATIEIFGGFICLMLAVIIFMNGREKNNWRLLQKMLFSISFIFFFEACAYIFRGDTGKINIIVNRTSNFLVFSFNVILVNLFI